MKTKARQLDTNVSYYPIAGHISSVLNGFFAALSSLQAAIAFAALSVVYF